MKKTIIILLLALLWACEKDQRYCWQCQYADLDKVNILIPETEHCEMWAKKTDDTPLFNIMC